MRCTMCGKEVNKLLNHHWRTDGQWHDCDICNSCNKLLIPSNFSMTESHCLPDFGTHQLFIAQHLSSKTNNQKRRYATLTVYKEDYDKLLSRKHRGFFIAGMFHDMVDKYLREHTLSAKE